MIKVNIANFYSAENWAIMANAGCQMIEEMMIRAFKQFPSGEELQKYPVNYQQDGREGKMHVELHENKGVWNVIEKLDRPNYSTGLNLVNPRTVNSWSEPYDDRPSEVILKEKEERRIQDLEALGRKLKNAKLEKNHREEQQKFARFRQFWGSLGLTEELIGLLP